MAALGERTKEKVTKRISSLRAIETEIAIYRVGLVIVYGIVAEFRACLDVMPACQFRHDITEL